MHARKRACLRARAYAYVRVKSLQTRHAPRQYRPENGFFRLADPAFWGFLPRYAAPRPPFLPRWPPFSRKFSPENPAPVCFLPGNPGFFARSSPGRPGTPPRIAPRCAVFRPVDRLFVPATPRLPGLRPGRAAHCPAFCPGDPGSARPGTPARLPRPGQPGLRPAPAQTSPLRRGEGLCDPQGASDPWPHRLETAAQVRVKVREMGAPGV